MPFEGGKPRSDDSADGVTGGQGEPQRPMHHPLPSKYAQGKHCEGKNAEDLDGNPVEYSKKNAFEALRDNPRFFDWVEMKSFDFDNYRKHQIEEVAEK